MKLINRKFFCGFLMIFVMNTSIYAYDSNALNTPTKIYQAVTMFSNIKTAAHNFVVGRPSYAGISIATLINWNLLPPSYTVNPWNGAVTIYASGPHKDLAVASMANIPHSACEVLAIKISNGGSCHGTTFEQRIT